MIYLGMVAGIVAVVVVVVVAVRLRDPHACARAGWTSRLEFLLDRDRDLVHALNGKGETPLHQAAWCDEVEALALLLERGGDVAARTAQRATPLHYAAAQGALSSAKLLVERGADVNAADEGGITPLFIARAGGHDAVATFLEQAGATADMPMLYDEGGGHFLTPYDPADPLWPVVISQARRALPTLARLFRQFPKDTMVKFAFQSDGGITEHIWGDLLELTRDGFRARVQTEPVHQKGPFERIQWRRLEDLEDWQVEQHDGTVRGGYGYQVVLLRTREKLGRLPREFAQHEHRFVDHDIPALLREAGLAGGEKQSSS